MAEIGALIDGKYKILEEIGHGGMSTVYLAMDQSLHKQWAVKEVRREYIIDPVTNERKETEEIRKKNDAYIRSILAEANLIKTLDHPAIPRIVNIINDKDILYIVMDYIDGESLDKVLKNAQGPLHEDDVMDWAAQVCDVLTYLHTHNPPVMYMDMKPANLMLKSNGFISIIDFGIAFECTAEALENYHRKGGWTKGYAPPEQLDGKKPKPQMDIYALGMTMYHLLTNEYPPTEASASYVSVRQKNPRLSDGVDMTIRKCVEPLPENRYRNCEELKECS